MNTNIFIQTLKLLALGVLGQALLVTSSSASIVADFTGGSTTAVVDGWTGKAGEGWKTAWSGAANADTNRTTTVTSSSPLYAGGGNYLYTTGSTVHTSSRTVRVSRQYENYEGVQLNSEHSLSFYFRLDDGIENLYRIRLFNGSIGALSPDTSSNWEVRNDDGNWRFSTINDSNANIYTNSTVRLYEGDVYFINLVFDPANGLYTAFVSNLSYEANNRTQGTASQTLTGLKLQGDDPSTLSNYLNFAVGMNGDTGGNLRSIAYSIDGITIVPEPGSVALSFGVGALLLWGIRRRFSSQSSRV